jgi:hypothetical protein
MRDYMKKLTSVLMVLGVAAALAAPRQASAQDSGFGLGIVVGNPTGLSFKGYIGPTAAIDGGIGYGFINDGHLAAYLDFLWEWRLTSWERAHLALYVGVGPKIGQFFDRDEFRVGARAPVGLAFQFTRVPLDFFVEVAAGLWFIQETDFDLDAGLGLRYWF